MILPDQSKFASSAPDVCEVYTVATYNKELIKFYETSPFILYDYKTHQAHWHIQHKSKLGWESDWWAQTHTHKIKKNSLATSSSYAHLAEPGCLCTKKALWAVQAKLLQPG